jgi:hypothetical protein
VGDDCAVAAHVRRRKSVADLEPASIDCSASTAQPERLRLGAFRCSMEGSRTVLSTRALGTGTDIAYLLSGSRSDHRFEPRWPPGTPAVPVRACAGYEPNIYHSMPGSCIVGCRRSPSCARTHALAECYLHVKAPSVVKCVGLSNVI